MHVNTWLPSLFIVHICKSTLYKADESITVALLTHQVAPVPIAVPAVLSVVDITWSTKVETKYIMKRYTEDAF